MIHFKLLFDGGLITNQTKLRKNGIPYQITNNKELCGLMYNIWRQKTQSKNFAEWCNSLNESGDYDSMFSKEDAIDNLCGLFQLNIDNIHVNTYDFFTQNFFKK